MRTSLLLGLGLLLAPAVAAQDTFVIYPDDARVATSATTRYNFGDLAGEMLQQVPAGNFAGVGDNGTACQVTNMTFTLQDQNDLSQENYSVIFRSAATGGGPDASAGGIIAQGGPFASPLGTGTIAAYLITLTFTTPVSLPCTGDYFFGISFNAVPSALGTWAAGTEGISIHHAYNPGVGTLGSNARATCPIVTWQIYATAPNGVRTGSARAANIGLGTTTPVLAIGNNDPSTTRIPNLIDYGIGGMFPAVKLSPRDDGLEARIADTANLNGTGVFFLGTTSFGPGIPLGGFSGRIWLNPTGLIIQLGTAAITGTTTGYAKIQVAPPTTIPAFTGITLFFQGVTVSSTFTNARFTNAEGVIG